MRARSLVHLSDGVLVSELKALLGRERAATAAVVAHMAEVDARRLYLPAGYPSMHAWCVGELGMSDDAAYKRIQAARAARRVPAIVGALADGRLHLTGVGLLAPYLTRENASRLIDGASRKTKSEIQLFLARRFPRTETLAMVQAVRTAAELAPAQVGSPVAGTDTELAPAQVGTPVAGTDTELAPAQVGAPAAITRFGLTPVAPGRFHVQFTIGQATYDKLMHAQALLSHCIPAGDLAQVLDRVLDAAIEKYEKQKFAKSSKPRAPRGASSRNTRHIPAHVKRAVWERDGGCCTFVSDSGKRCGSRTRLEFDHATPVAKGGTATTDGVRLRCRGHNHYEAERAFGAGFMQEKRRRERGSTRRYFAGDPDLTSCLQTLGFGAREISGAAAFCTTQDVRTLEERVKLALSWLRPKPPVPARSVSPVVDAAPGRSLPPSTLRGVEPRATTHF